MSVSRARNVILSIMATASAACNADGSIRQGPFVTAPTPVPPSVQAVKVTPAQLELKVGESGQVSATREGQPVVTEWASTRPETATVDGRGVVACVAGGGALISPTTVQSAERTLVTCHDLLAASVTPTLSFEHKIGASPCPQPVGYIDIRRLAGQRGARITLQSLHRGLAVESSSFLLENAGSRSEVQVRFNCEVREPFVGDIKVTVDDGVTRLEFITRVTGNVHP